MTYEENLRKTAEEMARYTHPNGWDSGFTETGLIQRYIPAAEYCLKKQAEAYRKGWSASCGISEIENELKKLGLIP